MRRSKVCREQISLDMLKRSHEDHFFPLRRIRILQRIEVQQELAIHMEDVELAGSVGVPEIQPDGSILGNQAEECRDTIRSAAIFLTRVQQPRISKRQDSPSFIRRLVMDG